MGLVGVCSMIVNVFECCLFEIVVDRLSGWMNMCLSGIVVVVLGFDCDVVDE